MVKWTDDENMLFVQKLVEHECLYNVKSANFKNKRLRDAAMLKISEAMGMPGFGAKEVYAKIRSIKSTYFQEKKKISAGCRSGAGAEDTYIPHITWYKLLGEAMNGINGECRESQSNLKNMPRVGQECNSENASRSQSIIDQTEQTATESEIQQPKKNTPSRKRQLRDLESVLAKAKSAVDVVVSGTSTNEANTEFDIFGKSIAAQLNNMPLKVAVQAQMHMQNYLSRLRLQQIGSHNSTRYLDTHSSPIPSSIFIPSPQPIPSSPSPRAFDTRSSPISPTFFMTPVLPQPTPSPYSYIPPTPTPPQHIPSLNSHEFSTSQPTPSSKSFVMITPQPTPSLNCYIPSQTQLIPSPNSYIVSTPQPTPSPNSFVLSTQPTPSPNSYIIITPNPTPSLNSYIPSQTQPIPPPINFSDDIVTIHRPNASETEEDDNNILTEAISK